MAVSKRLRFEVFRRDGYRCYYCGTRGNETTGDGLTIDHVTPVALGGSDKADNLVSACGDCNYGKSSTPADAETVTDIDRLATNYAKARALSMRALEADLAAEANYTAEVYEIYERVIPQYAHDFRGLDSFAADWHRKGVPLAVIEKALWISWESNAARSQKLRYAGGVVRHIIEDAEDRAMSIAQGNNEIYNRGFLHGTKFANGTLTEADLDGP